MFQRFHAKKDEEGFTLIELLVVVLIIAILAAIAVPVFLNQRKKAWVSQVESALKDASTAQESARTVDSDYSNSFGLDDSEAFCDAQLLLVEADPVANDITLVCEGFNYTEDEVGVADVNPAFGAVGAGGLFVLSANKDGYCMVVGSANDSEIGGWYDSAEGAPVTSQDASTFAPPCDATTYP